MNEWRKESRSKGTPPKQHFLLHLRHLLHDLNAKNLVSGFYGSSISPLNKEEVLKQMGSSMRAQSNFYVATLSECCKKILGLGVSPNQSQVRNKTKKIMSGQAITSLQNHENKENAEGTPGTSGHQEVQ